MRKSLKFILPLILALPGWATADSPRKCGLETLKGTYVFTASGFQRPPASAPGTPWFPKAIIEMLQFNGDGTVSSPEAIIANPPFPTFDGGIVSTPAPGANGSYSLGADCSGSVQFFDARNVSFYIRVTERGDAIQMLQTNPAQNVFLGEARRQE
ncbi:MAG: hypothetical protein JSS14_15110 [Proteobacteria bacterium]|nr:hypothetical protein [Pseudomonadota bacterium]